MWMTIASTVNSNTSCLEKLESSNLQLNEFPVDENSFFDCFSDQIRNHPLVLESQAYSSPEIVCNILHNYIVINAEQNSGNKFM